VTVSKATYDRVFLRVTPRSQAGGDFYSGIARTSWGSLGHVWDIAPSKDGVEPRIGNALKALAFSNLDREENPPVDFESVLILRGNALMSTQLEALRHGLSGVAYLVIVANSWQPSPLFPSVPTLFLTPNEPFLGTIGAAKHVTVRVLPDSVFLAELEVPGMIADWFEELDAALNDAEAK
jgi:hypothetical protein